MTTLAADDIPSLMRDWAEHQILLAGAGYPQHSPLYAATWGAGGSGPGSRVPAGVERLEVRGVLRRLILAMDALAQDDACRDYVAIIQHHYLHGPAVTMAAFGLSSQRLSDRIRQAELLLRREMCHH